MALPEWASKTDLLLREVDKELLKLQPKKLVFSRGNIPFYEETVSPPEAPPFVQPVEQRAPSVPAFVQPRMAVTRFPSAPPVAPEIAPAPPEAPPEEAETPQWYEQPKVLTEKAMEAVGRGVSKIPLVPEALKFVEPAFEFIQEKLEKPWAALITAPFSPSLPWKKGESWLEHQKREYEAWDAPVYVKGVAEFAMPLWWVPWLGWAGKGARALGVGSKLA